MLEPEAVCIFVDPIADIAMPLRQKGMYTPLTGSVFVVHTLRLTADNIPFF